MTRNRKSSLCGLKCFYMNGFIAICVFVFCATCTVGVCVLACLLDYALLNGTSHVEEMTFEHDNSQDTAPVPNSSDLNDNEVGKAEWVLEMVSLVKVILIVAIVPLTCSYMQVCDFSIFFLQTFEATND